MQYPDFIVVLKDFQTILAGIAAIIGGAFAYLAAVKTINHREKSEKIRRNEQASAFAFTLSEQVAQLLDSLEAKIETMEGMLDFDIEYRILQVRIERVTSLQKLEILSSDWRDLSFLNRDILETLSHFSFEFGECVISINHLHSNLHPPVPLLEGRATHDSTSERIQSVITRFKTLSETAQRLYDLLAAEYEIKNPSNDHSKKRTHRYAA